MTKFLFSTALSLTLVPGVSAWAQTTDSPDTNQAVTTTETASADQTIGDIVVTAQRRSGRLQDVPIAVSALGGDALARAPVSNLADIQTAIPNVNISPRNSSGVVAIRGIGFDIVTAGAEGSVAIHTDGVYQSRPVSALAGLYDVERIEVARGPQGTLYGRNATGGAINIVSHRPTTELSGYVSATYGNYDNKVLEGAVGGPIVADRVLVRIAGKVEDRDGYDRNLFNGRDVDDLKQQSVRGMLEVRATDTLKFLVIGDYYHRDDSSFPTRFSGCITNVCNANAATNRGFALPSERRDVSLDVQPSNKIDAHGVSLTTTLNLPFADLTAISAYRKGKNYFIFDLDGTAQPGAFITREENYRTVSQELQLGRTVGAVDWLVGGFFFDEHNYARANGRFPPFLAPTFTQYFQGGRLATQAYAAFGEITWRISNRFAVVAGGRYSSEKKVIRDEYTFSRGPAFITARQAGPTADIPCVNCVNLPNRTSFSSFTPKVGVQFRPGSDTLIYLTAQKGFKSGGFAVGAVTPSFAPESIWSYEGGVKASWFDRRLVTNLSVYHYDYSNLQVGQVVGVATIIKNAASARVDGVELELKAKLGDHIQLDAQGSYNNARFLSYTSANAAVNPNLPLDLSGNQLSNAPKKTGNVGLQYATAVGSGEVTLRGDVFASSRVWFSPFNNLNNSQKAYSLANASVRYDAEGGKWFASIYVNNIGNRVVKSGSNVITNLAGGFINAQLLPPRTFGAKLGFNF